MRPLSCILFFAVTSVVLLGDAYRILGIFPFNGMSHFVMFERLMKGLAEHGHQVDVVSHFPLKKPFPNYTDVVSLAGTKPNLVNNMKVQISKSDEKLPSAAVFFASVFGIELCKLMEHPEFQKLIKNPPTNPPYDLLITEIFGANCYLAIGQHLKVPVVGVVAAAMLPWANEIVANPDNTAYIPNSFSDFDEKMNFWQRTQNTLSNIWSKWQFNRISEGQNEAIKKYIGPHAPTVREAEKNVSLILTNSHYSLNGVRPFTTAVVEVGGVHIDEKEATFTNDLLQKFLDDSSDGFVYVSFGSMVKIESLPKEILANMYASFAKLAPVRVLMKIANPEELPPGLSSNVLTLSWIPQLAVLQHKNTRAFVTHGGLMGTQEAIYYGVPMIGIPLYGDQIQNIRAYAKMGIAVHINNEEITEENLDAAFRAVLNDPSYVNAVKTMSERFRDRPMSPLDTAIFWVEHVVRHGGRNLRSPAMDLTWWQIELIDVYSFLLSSIILALYIIVAIVKKVKSLFYPGDAKCEVTSHDKKVK
ncbi:UDP-glucosyltransferase 2-like [Neodiprion pinetum]|uniref:UDP-glucosyltransferase 2-like n=1 Tax=Neodiprion pinetum TaxID=441929 RepID=UPI001EE03AE8|nr:UDP-glucosyltransferase 2-like [Neodiprion pinetum]